MLAQTAAKKKEKYDILGQDDRFDAPTNIAAFSLCALPYFTFAALLIVLVVT